MPRFTILVFVLPTSLCVQMAASKQRLDSDLKVIASETRSTFGNARVSLSNDLELLILSFSDWRKSFFARTLCQRLSPRHYARAE